MQTSRVILANEPRLLRGMLRRAIARAPGLEVVGEVTDPAELASFIKQNEVQWVIVSIWREESVPSAVRTLLGGRSTPCILGLAADGSRAKIACTGAEKDTRGGLSLDDLIAILSMKEVNYSGNS
jgi:AmiR/NasT family two-component response regulator